MAADKGNLFRQFVRKLFRIFFHLLYHQFAWTYDGVAAIVSLGRWKNWVLSVLPYLEKTDILELGPGPGHLQIALAEKGSRVYGLDASKQMVRMASRRLIKKSLPAKISLGNAQNLPFSEETFDQIVATFPSEYIIDQQTLQQVHRVLKDQGEFIILPVAWITGKRWWDRLAAGLFRITGQAPDLSPESSDLAEIIPERVLGKYGFVVNSEVIQLPSSKVLLIRATKKLPHRKR